MDVPIVLPPNNPALSRRTAISAEPMAPPRRMADAIRALVIDAIGPPQPDHPEPPIGPAQTGMAQIGMADVATALWTRFHKFDAADPRWPDRDRFVLSAGHHSILLRALIHLTGHDTMSIDDIRTGPAAALYPGHTGHPAVETASGPCGEGLATAVGMALAERNMAARFGKSLVDHRTWVFASDDDLMAGISHEAAALAGHLGLSKLVVLYHDNRGSIDGEPALFCSDDVLKRFSAYGWATKQVEGDDPAQLNAALSFAVRSRKPTLVACRAATPPLAANAAATRSAAGSTRGRTPTAGGKPRIRWHDRPHDCPWVIPADVSQRWHAAGSRGAAARRSWLKRLARHNQRGEFERVISGRLPDTWHEAMADLKHHIADRSPPPAGRASGRVPDNDCLETLVTATPELIGGSAGSTAANDTLTNGLAPISVSNYGGRHIHYGIRGHAMAAAANGMALHGGIIPYVATGVAYSDALRPALRMAAIMRQRVIYVLTHDAAGIGRDGASDHPAEHLADLRAMSNVHVHRPADSMEAAECWELALRRADGPSLLVLPRPTLPTGRTDATENRCARGGYVLAEAEGPRHATLIATGSEVAIAMAARDHLAAARVAVAVVSLPCWEQFDLQDSAYRAHVLGAAPRVGIEAASGFGWDQWLGPDGTFIDLSGPAASAGHPRRDADFAITTDAVVAAVTRRLG
ncbi:transketolase-like TK C-terminal-containing protein [Rhodopila sp.]|uniref:transketolase-like TK C-terminal-containing protein n=1 Tax=Rhodopila sp. TaxID=2480087 RepID=UPI003D0CD9E7